MERVDSKKERPYQANAQRGTSVVEVVIVVMIVAVLLTFGFVGVTRARASMRLSGAAREFAAYIEKARVDSIRRHADDLTEAASVSINENRTSYVVTLDVDGDATMETRTIPLPDGITFSTVESIAFDWRGRTWSTVGGVTTSHAQVSITLTNGSSSVSADVTGSGDVTIDSRVFDDSVPNVSVRVGDLSSAASPTPGAVPTPSVSPSPVASASSVLDATPSPMPTPTATPVSTPIPTPIPTPTATPTPTPTPTPTVTPTPTPTPTPIVPCVLTASSSSISLGQDGTTTVVILHNSLSSVSITGTSSRSSDLQVTPGGAQTVAPGAAVTFTLKSKKTAGSYSVTFTASCGQVTVPVTIY